MKDRHSPRGERSPFEKALMQLRGSKTPSGTTIVGILELLKLELETDRPTELPLVDEEEAFRDRHYAQRRPDGYGAAGAY